MGYQYLVFEESQYLNNWTAASEPYRTLLKLWKDASINRKDGCIATVNRRKSEGVERTVRPKNKTLSLSEGENSEGENNESEIDDIGDDDDFQMTYRYCFVRSILATMTALSSPLLSPPARRTFPLRILDSSICLLSNSPSPYHRSNNIAYY